jgi:hypothetical protein
MTKSKPTPSFLVYVPFAVSKSYTADSAEQAEAAFRAEHSGYAWWRETFAVFVSGPFPLPRASKRATAVQRDADLAAYYCD